MDIGTTIGMEVTGVGTVGMVHIGTGDGTVGMVLAGAGDGIGAGPVGTVRVGTAITIGMVTLIIMVITTEEEEAVLTDTTVTDLG